MYNCIMCLSFFLIIYIHTVINTGDKQACNFVRQMHEVIIRKYLLDLARNCFMRIPQFQ